MITFVIQGKLLKTVLKISQMMLETNSALNSKSYFFSKKYLKTFVRKRFPLFTFYEFKKPKINLGGKINQKTGINHWVGTGIGPEIG